MFGTVVSDWCDSDEQAANVSHSARVAYAGAAARSAEDAPAVRLITLDPGHFHAALVQKFMYDGVDPRVRVYAPGGKTSLIILSASRRSTLAPINQHIGARRCTAAGITSQKMLIERAGNVVVISGNNARKTEYMWRAIEAGMNVLADKPMVIQPADFPRLQQTFLIAQHKGVLLMDIMTER